MQMIRKTTVLLLAAVMVMVSLGLPAFGQDQTAENERSAEKMAADALIVRPLGLLATALGAVLYLVALPYSILGGNHKETQQKLVKEPYQFTFERPLGDI